MAGLEESASLAESVQWQRNGLHNCLVILLRYFSCIVRFQVLMAASMMFRVVLWDKRTSETSVDNHFTRQYHSSLMMEAVRTSETSVENHFTRQYIPEDNSEHQLYRLYARGGHKAACARHWCGSQKIPLTMFGLKGAKYFVVFSSQIQTLIPALRHILYFNLCIYVFG
jgi:hypothetical protein